MNGLPWTAPSDPDPTAILREAKADARDRQYARALAKYLWFHVNALAYEPGLFGVRLSGALIDWYDLARVYPPAMDALEALRDVALDGVARRDDLRTCFIEFAAVNRALGQGTATRDAFALLDREDPAQARAVFDVALPELVKAREYALCNRYLDPHRQMASAIRLFRDGKQSGAANRDFNEFMFTHTAATLVSVLVVNGRNAEAEDVARRAKDEWSEGAFHAAINTALEGVVPESWP